MSRNDYQTIGSVVLTGILAATLAILNAACSRAAPIPAVHSDIPVVHSERALPAEVLAKPLVVYNRPYTEAIYADYVPCAREVTAPLEMAMARNEYEPVQIGIYVPSFAKPLHDIRLEIECDIPFQTGYIYYQPREELPGNITRLLREKGKPLEGKRDDIPLYIIPRNTITTLEAGRSGAFWVTFKTDATIPSGRHLGTAKVIASGNIIWELPLAVTIYPFELPRPTATFGFYYNPPQTPAKFQGLGFQRMYLADMAAHGMNTMNITLPEKTLAQPVQKECDEDLFMTPHISNPNDPRLGPLGVDPSSTSPLYVSNYMEPGTYNLEGQFNAIKFIDAQIKLGREVGLIQNDHPSRAYASVLYMEKEEKGNLATNLKRFSAKKHWPQMLLYMRDEPGLAVFDKVCKYVKQWKQQDIMTTCAMSHFAVFSVGHLHDVWIVLGGYITPELQHEAARQGAHLWTYHYNFRVTNTEANRHYAGLYTWSLGLEGNMPYAYMGERGAQPYFDVNWKLEAGLAAHSFSIHGFVIPSHLGPVPGVGYEGRREGIDDYRYLQLLEARIASANKSAFFMDNPVAVAAGNWLKRLRRESFLPDLPQVRLWETDYFDPHLTIEGGDYDAIRAKAADFILQLPPAKGEKNPEPSEPQYIIPMALESAAFEDKTLDECLEAIRTGTDQVKRQAVNALALREPETIVSALDSLIKLCDNPEVRMVAIRALAHVGPAAAPAMPSLRKLAASKDAFIRAGVITACIRIGGPVAAEVLAGCVQDPNPVNAEMASEALKKLKKK